MAPTDAGCMTANLWKPMGEETRNDNVYQLLEWDNEGIILLKNLHSGTIIEVAIDEFGFTWQAVA